MADYLITSNDWDLEAIIRGWGVVGGGEVVQVPLPPPNSMVLGFEGFEFEESEMVSGGNSVNELEEMYKPFVAQNETTVVDSPSSSSFVVFDQGDHIERLKMKEDVDLGVEDLAQPRSTSKRRKSKQKIVREVHRGVGEDGVAMDKWNWRKYGQKAIKGSPFPRSYYRCSSSTGCHARKHVEQSKDDCHTYIVTYIAEHSHLPPTRRHAQAGRKITKFTSSTGPRISPSPPSSSTMTWTVSGPSITTDHDYQTANTNGSLEDVMKDMFSGESSDHTNFDQDFNGWEFDPFFSTSIC